MRQLYRHQTLELQRISKRYHKKYFHMLSQLLISLCDVGSLDNFRYITTLYSYNASHQMGFVIPASCWCFLFLLVNYAHNLVKPVFVPFLSLPSTKQKIRRNAESRGIKSLGEQTVPRATIIVENLNEPRIAERVNSS